MPKKTVKKPVKKRVVTKKKKATAPRYWIRDVDLDKEIVLDKLGNRITNARAEEITKRVLARTAGRPSLTGPAKVSPEIKARVPLTVKRKVDSLAKAQKKTVSEIVREALEKYLRSA